MGRGARRARGATGRRHGAGRARRRPGSRSRRRSPRSWPPSRAPGVRLRPLRGHRPAGARPRRHPDDGPRGVDRRLRAQRRRGRRAGGHRGGRPAAARLHGQPRVAGRGVARRVDGLLEYPVYTKPAAWRGLDVPAGAALRRPRRIAAWRHDQALRRTARPPPRPAAPQPVLDRHRLEDAGASRSRATRADAGELLTLQRACWVQRGARQRHRLDIPPLPEDLDDVRAWLGDVDHVRRHAGPRLVGAVRGRARRGRPGTSAG